jgi:hypothetical protein
MDFMRLATQTTTKDTMRLILAAFLIFLSVSARAQDTSDIISIGDWTIFRSDGLCLLELDKWTGKIEAGSGWLTRPKITVYKKLFLKGARSWSGAAGYPVERFVSNGLFERQYWFTLETRDELRLTEGEEDDFGLEVTNGTFFSLLDLMAMGDTLTISENKFDRESRTEVRVILAQFSHEGTKSAVELFRLCVLGIFEPSISQDISRYNKAEVWVSMGWWSLYIGVGGLFCMSLLLERCRRNEFRKTVSALWVFAFVWCLPSVYFVFNSGMGIAGLFLVVFGWSAGVEMLAVKYLGFSFLNLIWFLYGSGDHTGGIWIAWYAFKWAILYPIVGVFIFGIIPFWLAYRFLKSTPK